MTGAEYEARAGDNACQWLPWDQLSPALRGGKGNIDLLTTSSEHVIPSLYLYLPNMASGDDTPVPATRSEELVILASCTSEDVEANDVLDFESYHDDPSADTEHHEDAPIPVAQSTAEQQVKRPLRIGIAVFAWFVCVFFVVQRFWVFRLVPSQPKPILKPSPLPLPPPSQNYSLNFPEIFPKLDVRRSTPKCRDAWQTLMNVPCHEGILLRDWDYGPNPESASMDTMIPLLCGDRTCSRYLDMARNKMNWSCAGENVFDLEDYKGKLNTSLLEANVKDAVGVLVRRHERNCRISPQGDAIGGYCMTDLDTRFGIVDGILSDAWEDLDSFLNHTPQNFSTVGTTTCSWCTITWFREKLEAWKVGSVAGSGSTLSLPAYLQTWETAGRRCAGQQFDDTYNGVIKSYVDRGLLTKDWLPKPSREIAYLIRNGATMDDYPIPEIMNVHSILTAYINRTVDEGIDTHRKLVLANEYTSCLTSIHLAAQSLNSYPFFSWSNITTHILRDIPTALIACSEQRSLDVIELRGNTYSTCPGFRNPSWGIPQNTYDQELAPLFLPFSISPILKEFGTLYLYLFSACQGAHTLSDNSHPRRGDVPCAAIFAQWGMQDWALNRCGENMQEIIRVTRRELLKVPNMPSKLRDFHRPMGRPLTEQEKAIEVEKSDWVWDNTATGVCSDCVWRRFVNQWGIFCFELPFNTNETAMEALLTVNMLRSRCSEVGNEFPKGEWEQASGNWKL